MTNANLRDPVIAHIHVPKTAGTSFRSLLIRHFGAGHLALYADDTFFVYSEKQISAYLADRSIRAFSSHFVRTFPPLIACRDILYVTFLRDPIQTFLSYLTYVKKVFGAIRDPNLLSCLPPDLPALSLREAVRWVITSEREINFKENYLTNFFARFVFQKQYGHSAPRSLYVEKRLSIAKRTLGNFFFVGIVEQMDRSVQFLQSLARAIGIEFPAEAVGSENISSDFRDDLSWITAKDEVGAKLLDSVRTDYELYRWAVARFEERAAALLPNLHSPSTLR